MEPALETSREAAARSVVQAPPDSLNRTVTIELRVEADSDLCEILVAELSQIGFDAFSQFEGGLLAYVNSPMPPFLRERVTDVLEHYLQEESWLIAEIPAKNWNQAWEESIEPVIIGPFVVRPPWKPFTSPGLIEIVVSPKMSFGTGHHESTRLILRHVAALCADGVHVLDAGTGTGILGVAAVKLGATRVVAFDNDPWSIDNALETVVLNGVESQIQLVEGTLSDIDEGLFDLVLANISKYVLLSMLSGLRHRVRDGGHVVLSGLLNGDREEVLLRAVEARLDLVADLSENEWWSAVLKPSS